MEHTDDTSQYQEHYSEEGFLKKIIKFAAKAGKKVLYYALVLFYMLKDPNVPAGYKTIIVGALGYFIFPIDLIPDIIPVVGFSDDLAALVAALKSCSAAIQDTHKKQAQKKLRSIFGDDISHDLPLL